jgi:hypothetical protein
MSPSARYVAWLVRRRVVVLVLAAVVAAVAGYRTVRTYAALRSDLEELLPVTAPSVQALDVLRARLPGIRHLGVVVDTGGKRNVAAANRFLDDLAKRIRHYPPHLVGAVRTDVDTERRFIETYLLQLMAPADVRKLVTAVEKRRDWEVTRKMGINLLTDEEEPEPKLPVDELRRKYDQRYGQPSGFPGGRLVSADGGTAVLLVQASNQATSYEADQELLDHVKQDISELGFPGAYGKGMRVGFAGDVATRVEELTGLFTDLSASGVLVLLLVVGVIVWFFRSWRALPLLGLPLLAGTLAAFGIVALPPLGIRHLNSNTAFLGSIVVGNGINSGIILLARFTEERRRGVGLDEAISTAVSGTWKPTLAAALAASAAYGSLVFTAFRGFNQFGWIGGFGMLSCWVTTFVLAPPLLSLFGAPLGGARRPRDGARPGPLRRSAQWLLGRPRSVLAGTVLLAVLSLLGLHRRAGDWIQYDLSKLRRREAPGQGERYWGRRMDATLRRYLTPTVVMADTPRQARLIEERARKLAREGRAGGLIGTVRSAADVLRPDRAESIAAARKLKKVLTPHMLSELSDKDRKLVERALSPPALVPLQARQVPDVLLAGLREYGGRVDRSVLVYPKLSSGTWDTRRMEAFTHDLRRAATVDGRAVPVAGSLLLSSDIATAMKHDGPKATALSLVAVLLICLFSFRSLGLSLAAVASVFVGVALMLGGLAWGGAKLNFSNFVALPITFGIGADYSINMLKRYQAEGRLDLRAALGATGGAVALCSATTIIGFGSLLVAQNRALFSFGVFAVSGELACLVTAIIALPAALVLLGQASVPRAGTD